VRYNLVEVHGVIFHGGDSQGPAIDVSTSTVRALRAGRVAILVVTQVHRAGILARAAKQVDVDGAIAAGSLIMLDAVDVIDRVTSRGYPDPDRFETTIGQTIRDLAGRGALVYAYGEAVGLLWQAGQYPAAVRLEQLWNGLARRFSFELECGYPIDVLGDDFEATAVDGVLRAHTHVLGGERETRLALAIDRAFGEILGGVAEATPHPNCSDPRGPWAALPRAEAAILWLKAARPDRSAEVLERAREYYGRSA
jgi:hypothetical protein